MGGLGDVSKTTMDQAKSMLGGLEDPNRFLTVSPSQIEIEQGGDAAIKVIILNQDRETLKVQAKTAPVKSDDKDIECIFFDTASATSENYEIGSGKYEIIPLLIADSEGPIRTSGCKVEILGGPAGEDSTETAIVRVEAKTGIFE